MRLGQALKILLSTLAVAVCLKIFLIEAVGIPSGSMAQTLLAGDYVFVNKFLYGVFTPRSIPLTSIRLPFFKFFPGYSDPSSGDVIVFEAKDKQPDNGQPETAPQYFVKRITALPGETIEIAQERIYINGSRRQDLERSINASALERGEIEPGIFPKGKMYNRDWWGPEIVPFKGMRIEITMDNLDEWRSFMEQEGHPIRFTPEGNISIDGIKDNVYIVEQNYYFALGDNRGNSEDSRYTGFIAKKDIVGAPFLIYWSWDASIPVTRPLRLLGSIRWERLFNGVK